MRKTVLYSMLLTGFVLFGCSAKHQSVNPTTNSNPNTNINTTNQAKIDEQQAKEIALKEAGGGQVTEFSYDMDDYTPNYDITVLNGTSEYEYEISAVDGTILKRSVENHPTGTNTTTIDEAKVKEIVNDQVKGTIVSIKLDQDDARLVYDVTVVDETYKYEYEISAVDGSIVSQDRELINQASNSTNMQGVTIDEAKVKEIALGQVPNGTITEISFDYEMGILVYGVTVIEGTTEYEFEISGVDGSIVSKSMDSRLD
ncbi:MAG: PepSY domain-containing protein [Turicibacter sp.]|nr:PepSY domain-containing protein [Turicibacter sp.]